MQHHYTSSLLSWSNTSQPCCLLQCTPHKLPLWVTSSSGPAVQVYCDMDRVCGCSSTGGWTRVANLNMSDPLSEQCSGEWIYKLTAQNRGGCVGGVAVQDVSQLNTALTASATAMYAGK